MAAGFESGLTSYSLLAAGGESGGTGILVEVLLGAAGALTVLLFVFASFLALMPLLIAAVSILTTFILVLALTTITDVSIIVQFRVTDPRAALHQVERYEDRLYSDVQLAARRSLASTTLEEILTNRNRLSEDILRDVTEAASGYGVAIQRADVKDLIFPGNLQEIMNRVLAAERMSEAQLVEARTKSARQ